MALHLAVAILFQQINGCPIVTNQPGKNIYTTLAQTKSKHLSKQQELLVGGAGSSGYRELNERLNRVQELKRVKQKMETKKKLVSKERHVHIPGSDGIQAVC